MGLTATLDSSEIGNVRLAKHGSPALGLNLARNQKVLQENDMILYRP